MAKDIHPLKTASLKVLEDWAMMLVDEVNEVSAELFNPEQRVYMSWVSLHGVITGAVSIVAQEQFLKALANNILGSNGDIAPTSEDGKDAFKEMGNVLAGNFLTEAYGEDVVFDLFNPSVTEVPFAEVDKFTQRNIVFAFMADDIPVAVTFSIKRS